MDTDRLIESHMPFARRLAWRRRRTCPLAWGDDIESAAFEGLVRSAHDFEPGWHVTFESFAAMRIRYAIIDEVRHLAGSPPGVIVRSFAVCDGDPVGGRPYDFGDPAHDVVERVANEQRAARVLRPLNDSDRQVVRWYYYDELTLAQIGGRIGVTESRVSKRLTAIRARLARMSTAA